MYAVIKMNARSMGKKPGLKLAWVSKVNPDGSVRAVIAPLDLKRDMPRWTKTPRLYQKSQVAQFFGPNVKPTAREIAAIRARLQPYNPRQGVYADLVAR